MQYEAKLVIGLPYDKIIKELDPPIQLGNQYYKYQLFKNKNLLFKYKGDIENKILDSGFKWFYPNLKKEDCIIGKELGNVKNQKGEAELILNIEKEIREVSDSFKKLGNTVGNNRPAAYLILIVR